MLSALKAAMKYLWSFTRKEWELSDYPLRYRRQKPGSEGYGCEGLKLPAWYVQIINWWQISGLGDTKDEAYADLKTKFERMKAEGGRLPRPGTGLLITLAATREIDQYALIATDFFNKVLQIDYNNCFISDESSLWDFHTEASNATLNERIKQVYGVDVADIESGNLVQIFERIRGDRALEPADEPES